MARVSTGRYESGKMPNPKKRGPCWAGVEGGVECRVSSVEKARDQNKCVSDKKKTLFAIKR